MMVFSRDAATYGATMRPILSPLNSAKIALNDGAKRNAVGIELALPVTILAFIVLASQSPMLNAELDYVLDWFVKNDQYFWSLTAIILALPLRMIAVMFIERRADKARLSGAQTSAPQAMGSDSANALNATS
ncbi:MAG: hypothetical protein K2X77_12620 [Candidatus Obscuribacterales bacterium]|jgi:hypothetical protein|nr:hypothetical protein [Candidatus Obscuribacterales bacterium]